MEGQEVMERRSAAGPRYRVVKRGTKYSVEMGFPRRFLLWDWPRWVTCSGKDGRSEFDSLPDAVRLMVALSEEG